MFPSFATQTVTRLRPEMADDGHGNTQPDWTRVSSTPIANVVVQPGASEENLLGRDATLIRWTVLAQAGTDILATDRISYQGVTHEVDGPPMAQPSPTGNLSHVVILLKLWNG